ncbi:response regulator transcription factor [Nocardioides rotundus]|uniref:response regulator transcription factor n=1 Tax=Nocardioides rotundus TaxID=1774216 RepID=UPI001CBB0334|nr:response regulator transcription factor [Nocardioides rotundus]UAL29044.1 response regulator transcription factor [Nocardioides rotundus]
MIRIAVVDDQELVREGLSMMLSAQTDLDVVLEAAHGRAFLDALDTSPAIDLVLLDLRMPVMDGIATLAELSRLHRRPAVLVVTTFARDQLVVEAIASGADGYVLKRGSRADLLRAVRTVAQGGSVLAPEVTRAVTARLRTQPSVVPADLSGYRLTRRELDVLGLVGCGLNNHEIADQLSLSPHTVKTHLTSVLAKTGSRDRTQAALLAIRAGLA